MSPPPSPPQCGRKISFTHLAERNIGSPPAADNVAKLKHEVMKLKNRVCGIFTLVDGIVFYINIDLDAAEVFTDPGKASEQYPGNPGHVVRADEGEATNNKVVATVNTRAIFPARILVTTTGVLSTENAKELR